MSTQVFGGENTCWIK